jgi:hypothetical protein
MLRHSGCRSVAYVRVKRSPASTRHTFLSEVVAPRLACKTNVWPFKGVEENAHVALVACRPSSRCMHVAIEQVPPGKAQVLLGVKWVPCWSAERSPTSMADVRRRPDTPRHLRTWPREKLDVCMHRHTLVLGPATSGPHHSLLRSALVLPSTNRGSRRRTLTLLCDGLRMMRVDASPVCPRRQGRWAVANCGYPRV